MTKLVRRSLILAALILGFQNQVAGQGVTLSPVRTQLENFRENVRLAISLLDPSKLQLFSGERLHDLAAFGLVNYVRKSLNKQAYASARLTVDGNFKKQLTAQIAAGCGSPGPKPTKDLSAMRGLRAAMIPGFYNKMLLMIASEGKSATFGTIQIQTELEAGKVFYFPVLNEPFETAFRKLPSGTQKLLDNFLLK